MTTAATELPAKPKPKDAPKDPTPKERGLVELRRAQFVTTIEIPSLGGQSGRTLWVDGSNRAYMGVAFLLDRKNAELRLEKPGDEQWPVLVPLSNVAAMFPKE
jgi:hypothetical protein